MTSFRITRGGVKIFECAAERVTSFRITRGGGGVTNFECASGEGDEF